MLGCMVESSAMELTLDGELRRYPGTPHRPRVGRNFGCAGKRIVVERNGEIVPRGRHVEAPLTDSDQMEVVVAGGSSRCRS